jgi:Fe-S-cluster containining protein
MKLNVSLEEISDGRLYHLNDMVKADTRGCQGCSACCHGVGSTIVLTPFDMYQIIMGTNRSYDELINKKIELHAEEKITLPNIKMLGQSEACGFLDENERCAIHNYRPSICRLFPLGRYYEGDDFKYFLQPSECVMKNLSKIKVKNWIGIQNYNENKKFILAWHDILKAIKWRSKFIYEDKALNEVNEYLIDTFYRIKWQEQQDFYDTFYNRVPEAKAKLGIL